MTKKLLFFIVLLSIKSFSQSIANQYSVLNEKLKSPQVHLLKQFIDQPVDLSRGLVDISIPIYDISFIEKNIPIKIMLHPSGLKANASEIGILGLKWALNAGGFITREVKGIPDEHRNHKQGINNLTYTPDWMVLYGGGADKGYFNNNVVFQTYDLQYIGMPGVYGQYEDTEYDIFTFSLPNGESGKFILKDINGNKSVAFMPYKPYKLKNLVSEPFSTGNMAYTKFEIIDDQGYIYTFGKNNLGQRYYETDIENKYLTTWMLVSITSPNNKESIDFDYFKTTVDGNSPLTPVIINDYLKDFNNYYPKGGDCKAANSSALYQALQYTLDDSAGYLTRNYNEPPYHNTDVHYISKISYKNFAVDFFYNGERLKNIEITQDNKTIKKANFNLEGLVLKSVSILGTTNNIEEKYSFDYYNLNRLPTVQQLANRADYWGYYQSQVENVILKDTVSIRYRFPGCYTPETFYSREIGSGNNRYSISEDMKIGMIKSINYPTGGSTIFDYEGNQYKDGNLTRECGGLRIKSIISKDKNGSNLKKREFKYGLNEDGIGRIPEYLKPDPSVRNRFEELETTYYIEDDLQFEFVLDYGTYTSRYLSGFFPANYYTYLYNIVAYDKITEYSGDSNNNIGKTENFYEIYIPPHRDYEFDYGNFSYQRHKFIIDPSDFWSGNHLQKKIDYKVNNGLYSKIRQTDYDYSSNQIDEIYDVSIFRFRDFIGYRTSGLTSMRTAIEELELVKNKPSEFFGYKVQKYTIGVENLSSVREELFFDNGTSIVQTTANEYDVDKPSFLKQSTSSNSKGENLVQKYLYPFNINTGIYSQMSNANILSPLVEKTTLKNNKIVNSTVLTYKKSDDNFVPDQNYTAELNTPLPTSQFSIFNGINKDAHYSPNPEITYDLYDDKGNPTQITPKGKASVCYIWGYDKKYPIATIENASFIAGQPNSISSAQQTLINNAVSASFAETNSVTESNLVDKLKLLRAGFPNAMVTTYTYDPSIGITSMTDSKDFTTYYEYDSYGRLKQVKDNDKKVLSANKYHYTN